MKKFEDMTNDEKEILISAFIVGYTIGEIVGDESGTSEAADAFDGMSIPISEYTERTKESYEMLKEYAEGKFIDKDGCLTALNDALSEFQKK